MSSSSSLCSNGKRTACFARLAGDRVACSLGFLRLDEDVAGRRFCLVSFRLRCRLKTNSSWLDSLLESVEEEATVEAGANSCAGR